MDRKKGITCNNFTGFSDINRTLASAPTLQLFSEKRPIDFELFGNCIRKVLLFYCFTVLLYINRGDE